MKIAVNGVEFNHPTDEVKTIDVIINTDTDKGVIEVSGTPMVGTKLKIISRGEKFKRNPYKVFFLEHPDKPYGVEVILTLLENCKVEFIYAIENSEPAAWYELQTQKTIISFSAKQGYSTDPDVPFPKNTAQA